MSKIISHSEIFSSIQAFPCYLSFSPYIHSFTYKNGYVECHNEEIKKNLEEAFHNSFDIPKDIEIKGTFSWFDMEILNKYNQTNINLWVWLVLICSISPSVFSVSLEDVSIDGNYKQRHEFLLKLCNSLNGCVTYSVGNTSIFFFVPTLLEALNSFNLIPALTGLQEEIGELYTMFRFYSGPETFLLQHDNIKLL